MGESFLHFSLSQTINLIWASIVYFVIFYAIQPQGLRQAMEQSFYFIFLYLGFVILMFLVCWLPKVNCQTCLTLMGIIGFIGGSLFIGLFFGIFFKPLNYTYYPSKNCTATKLLISNFENSEYYAAINIQFENQKGVKLNGYACASSKKESNMGTTPFVYSYYQRDEEIQCNDIGKLKKIEIEDVLNNNYYKNNRRQLQQDDHTENSNTQACTYIQNIYDVKLSSWHCLDFADFLKDFKDKNEPIVYENCYYTIYGDEKLALENSDYNKNLPADSMSDFYMVIFDNPPYYDRLAFQLIIAFCFIPFLSFTQFCWIPQVAKKLEPKTLQFFKYISQQKPQTQQNNQEQKQQNSQKQQQQPRKNNYLDSEEAFQEKQQNSNISDNSQQNNKINNDAQKKPQNNFNFDNIDNQYDTDLKNVNNDFKNIILKDQKY